MPKRQPEQVYYGRTPQGQLIYDLAFTRLSLRYLARKHHLPIDSIRRLRPRVRAAVKPKRKRRT